MTHIGTGNCECPIVYKNNALMNKIFCIVTAWPEMVNCSNNYILLQSSKTPIDTGNGYCPIVYKVSKGAKIMNRYNQVPHLTQDTNGKLTNSNLDTTKESQEVSPFTAGDHNAQINRRTQRHNKHKT